MLVLLTRPTGARIVTPNFRRVTLSGYRLCVCICGTQLQSLKLAGLEAQTREKPDVPLPTSPQVALPCVTVFAAAAHENFLDAIDVSDLVGTYSTAHRPLTQPQEMISRPPLSALPLAS